MESEVLNALLEYGALGLFAGFLVWQHLSMQKRLDKLVERFQTQLDGIQEKSDANEEKLRDRYDLVISQLRDDKTTFRVNVSGRIDEAIRKIEVLETSLNKLPFDALQIQIESISLNQRNSHLILEKVREIMSKTQEEAKLKEMARKLSKKDA